MFIFLKMRVMRKPLSFTVFMYITFCVYSQTWVVGGRKVGVDYEYTIITKTQFERILRANEQTSSSVMLNYMDNIQMFDTNVKSGTRPNLSRYYYLSTRGIPRTDIIRIVTRYIKTMLLYGNSETGVMTIMFCNTYIPDSISLEFERNEYNRKFNQLL